MKLFTEGFNYPNGPLKHMSQEDITKIHIIAEIKLEELEETGLSREEILDPNTK